MAWPLPKLDSGRDKRVLQRVRPREDQPIEVQIVGSGFIEMVKARDISVGGLGICIPHHFEGCDLNVEIELVVTLPNQKPFMARGFIRHRGQGTKDDFFGVQFTKVSPDDLDRVRIYVAKRAGEGGLI